MLVLQADALTVPTTRALEVCQATCVNSFFPAIERPCVSVQGDPVWTPINHPDADEHPVRSQYVSAVA